MTEILYQPELQNKEAYALSQVSHPIELTMITTRGIVEMEIVLEEGGKDEEFRR